MVSTKIATSKSNIARKKNIKSTLKKMSKIAASQECNPRNTPPGNHAPIILGRRLVLRSRIPVEVKLFTAFHKLYKDDSIRATSILNLPCSGDDGEPTRIINVALRCAIQELWEDRLKTASQLLGLFPPDPELTRPTQELFEQFWEAHGYPNDAEIDLLERAGRVDAATVDAWFILKDVRLRTYRLMQEKMRASILKTLHGQKSLGHIVRGDVKMKKPHTRH